MSPYTCEKSTFWNELGETLGNSNLPWILLGDLNEVMNEGDRPLWQKKLYMKPVLQSIGAIDLGFNGKHFTWENNQKGRGLIKERIDRAFLDKNWLSMFPFTKVQHLAAEFSDHCPIFICTENREDRSNRPFKFLQAWTTNKQSHQIVHQAWSQETSQLCWSHKLNLSFRHTTRAL